MSRVLTLARHDARLQFRYGIYVAYAFVVGFYVFMLTSAAPYLPSWAVGVIIYSDPAGLGFFFLGALMMLEKAERVRTALATAPVSSAEYFAAKVMTLSSVSLIACGALLIVVHSAPNPALLLAAVALTSIMFIGIGVPVALRFRTVNGYLVGAGALLTPVIAPAGLALLEPLPNWLLIWPPVAQFRLILIATGYGTASLGEVVLMLAVCFAAAAAASWFAIETLKTELGK
ncbi:MAG: hypothetical protein ABL866_11560 [Devosia sp.]